jgi:hypothetical protein
MFAEGSPGGLRLFVYLSNGGRAEIPAAVFVSGDEDFVSFLDEAGQVLAVFRRRDVVMYSRADLGDSVSVNEEAESGL